MLAEQSSKIMNTSGPSTPDLLGAQLVGRWKSGAPIAKTPLKDNLTMADGTPLVNDFEFGDDREGFKCPWAAHVRKAYPRDELPNTSHGGTEDEIRLAEARTQTHRMMRRGIAFGPELTRMEATTGVSTESRGLLFKCYVSSIKTQFEFVQRNWINDANFPQPNSGSDPIIGQGNGEGLSFLGASPIKTSQTDKPSLKINRFVHFMGGEYFFAPSISQIIAGFTGP